MSRKRPPHFAVYSSSTDRENGVPAFRRFYSRFGLARFLVSSPGPWTIEAHDGSDVRFGKGPSTWRLDYFRSGVPGQAIFSVNFPHLHPGKFLWGRREGENVRAGRFDVEILAGVEVVS